ncbi:hypothetical protein D3C72_1853910 [compost metagenome]
MVAVCKAFNPLASNNATATTPMLTDQKMRCHKGEWSCPVEANISTTSAPESAEVIKNTTTISTATIDTTLDIGKCSRKANNANELSCPTTTAKSLTPSLRIMCNAESPNTVIHNRVKPAGTKSTPQMNSRMVRPREMRAMNNPTKGDQDSHQPQYNRVQPPIQSVGS